MKVTVNLQVAPKAGAGPADTTLAFVVREGETVCSVKERIADAQSVAFPDDQEIVFNGKVLRDDARLADCGVEEGGALSFVVRASEERLVEQLSQLLQARDLLSDELGLLYCYKHGASIKHALAAVGFEGKLQDFLKSKKQFIVESGRVTLVREDTALKPFSAAQEVKKILEAGGGSMEISAVNQKFVQKFNASLASIVGTRPAEFLLAEKDLFVVTGRNIVSLKGEAPATAAPEPQDAGDAPPPGLGAEPASEPAAQVVGGQEYLDLHNRVSGRSFNSRIAQALTELVEALTTGLCLNVARVERGGSVGKGTAVSGVTDAEVVLFLRHLPQCDHSRWLPPLLKMTAGLLQEQQVATRQAIEEVRVTEDSVWLRTRDLTSVDIRFSTDFGSYSEALEVMGRQAPENRKFYAPALIRERVLFIAKQPGQVKVTVRLLKWWRDQQEWSCDLARPSDDVLELIAVYSAVQTKPVDQRQAIANVMSLFARFEDLRIVWSNYYSRQDIWAPLLQQRPLLMDPTNPYVNVADPQLFDARELMTLARITHFFW